MNKYVFKRHDSIFFSFFPVEKRRLGRRLRKEAEVEHVGSTAVRGLGGKNILDIVVGIRSGRPLRIKDKLESLGYTFLPNSGTKTRRFFTREAVYKKKKINIHLHLVRMNGIDWKEMVAFRDYLSDDRDALEEYVAVKKKAAKIAKGDKKRYMELKDKFIKRAIKKAFKERGWRLRRS